MAFRMNFDLIKRHPAATAGVIIVGGFLLYYFFLRGSSSAQTGVMIGSGQPSDTAIQAATQLQLAQQAGQQQATDQSFQLNYLQQQQAGDLAAANLNAQTSTTQQVNAISGELAIQGQQLSTQASIINAQTQADLAKTQINANTQLQSQYIATQGAVTLAQLETNANVAINSTNAQVQSNIAQYQAQAAIGTAQAYSNAAVSIQGIKTGGSAFSSVLGLVGSFL